MRRLRIFFQIAVMAAALVTGFRAAMGWTGTTVETYCPFGGLETAASLFTERRFTCVTGERNLALFVALIVLTLLARKSFCSWVCPVGAVSEWLAALGRRFSLGPRRDAPGALSGLRPGSFIDRALRSIRIVVLFAILYFTYKTGELVFRGYDPYYILAGFGAHGITARSYVVLALVLVGSVFVPMSWCRYLCPLGAALWPFSALGRLRVARNGDACKSCRACDRACPQSILVSAQQEVRSGECTLCFECMEACPEKGALELRWPWCGKAAIRK
ncbi:MAG: 4Fe-4S binding protein [Pseudomonadota bacterium]